MKKLQKTAVAIKTPYISVDKLLKFSGVAETGGQAFYLVEQGLVRLNGVLISEKRKKCYVGDVVNIDGQIEITVTAEA